MALFRAALLSALASNIHVCTAHVQMSWPFPLRSPLNPAVPESLKDYDMASPLRLDGSDFPCKNYQYNATNSQAFETTASYMAGGTYNISLAGGATHLGGSCQISLSYDNGATFKVIESIIGGCPLSSNYDFTVPEFAPASDSALLSWSWFNLIGEQNMYQNCARVQVVGTGLPASEPQVRRRTMRYESRRQTAFDALPDLFVCDVGNGCRTLERQSVVFPNPGSSIQYGQDGTDPIPGPGFVLSNSTASTTSSIALPTTTSAPPFPAFNTTSTVGPTGTGFTTANMSTLSTTSTLSVNSTSTFSSTTLSTTSSTSTTSSDLSSTSASSTSTTSSSSSSSTSSTTSSTTSSATLSSTSSTTTSLTSSSTTDSAPSTSSNPAPTQVTVTVTFTVTPTASTATPFESVVEVITIVPISELSILGVAPTGV